MNSLFMGLKILKRKFRSALLFMFELNRKKCKTSRGFGLSMISRNSFEITKNRENYMTFSKLWLIGVLESFLGKKLCYFDA